MGKFDKLSQKIMLAQSDANIAFADLCALLLSLGFRERISGGHHIFTRPDVIARINLQKDGNKAKSYQVRQVRNVLQQYGKENHNA